jgi:hypothetical protein
MKASTKAHKGNLNPRTRTVQALKLIVQCNQALSGIITDTIRITRLGPAHKRGKRGKLTTAVVHLRSVNFSVAAGIRTVFTDQLGAAIVSLLANARSATATFLLAGANPHGTVGVRQTLTLVRSRVGAATAAEGNAWGVAGTGVAHSVQPITDSRGD